MGILNEFNSIYKDEGIVTAGSWVGRNVLLSFFHPATYRLVDALSPLVLDRNEIEERFQINGSIEYYDREREVEIELPAGEDHVETIAKRSGTYKISKPFVGLLYDVDLFGAYPIPVDNQNKLALETVVSPEVLTLNIAGSVGEFIINPPKKISNGSTAAIDSAVLLYNQWNSGYYHWTVETLNRLEGVEKYTYRTGEQPKLIVGPDPNRFQLETLELLGYDEEDLIRWNQRQGSVDRLVVPSVRREYNLGSVSPIAYQWLRDRMRKAAR